MSTFLPVIPQQPGQKTTAGISISKKPSSCLQAEFEKFKLNLHANPGQSLYDYCSTNGVSYDALRGYASRNHINIRELRRESVSSTNSEKQCKSKSQLQQIHVIVKAGNISYDVTGINFNQLSTLIERAVNHV